LIFTDEEIDQLKDKLEIKIKTIEIEEEVVNGKEKIVKKFNI